MTWFERLVSWAVMLAIPFFLLMTSIRILFSPLFLEVEYRRPGFPPDMYGFSMQDRLKWAKISMDYLLNDSDISFLGDKTLPDGSPLYIQSELSHMLDVKIVVQKMLIAWYILLAGLIGVGFAAWKFHALPKFWLGVSNGGWLTIGLILLAMVNIFLNFNALFTAFHRIFFVGESWIFLYSDTLIRLFPIRFWQDAFILVGFFSVTAALLLAIFGKKLGR